MSTYYRRTKNPVTGQFEQAVWLDDHFGRHRYGVQFGNGPVYRQTDHVWEFEDGQQARQADDPENRLAGHRQVRQIAGQADTGTETTGDATPPPKVGAHPQLLFIKNVMRELESLRDAAVCNGVGEQRLAAYLRAACKCVELALMEAGERA